eukprot:904582-Prorocentrum_minimum.AAC.1
MLTSVCVTMVSIRARRGGPHLPAPERPLPAPPLLRSSPGVLYRSFVSSIRLGSAEFRRIISPIASSEWRYTPSKDLPAGLSARRLRREDDRLSLLRG